MVRHDAPLASRWLAGQGAAAVLRRRAVPRRVSLAAALAVLLRGSAPPSTVLAARAASVSSVWGSVALSADGRHVAFAADADALVPGDANGRQDVFVRDRLTGAIERVSVAADGREADGASEDPAVSADGRIVAFTSTAKNLTPHLPLRNADFDVYVKDRLTGAVELVNAAADGSPGNGVSGGGPPVLSADGRYVLFGAASTNLVPGVTTPGHLYLKDRRTGAVELVSAGPSGVPANNGSEGGSLSADGRYAAFTSWASNLVPGDTGGTFHAYVKDRATGAVERVDVAPDGSPMRGASSQPVLSADGRFVAFTVQPLLIPSQGFPHVYVKDRRTGAIGRVSETADGTPGSSTSAGPAISADGRFVAFRSDAPNLVRNPPDLPNAPIGVLVKDRLTGAVERASTTASGTPGDRPALSADGRFVAFTSEATNLVQDGAGGAGSHWIFHAYVKDRRTGAIERVSAPPPPAVSSSPDAAPPPASASGTAAADSPAAPGASAPPLGDETDDAAPGVACSEPTGAGGEAEGGVDVGGSGAPAPESSGRDAA